jgi:hypothetical protein
MDGERFGKVGWESPTGITLMSFADEIERERKSPQKAAIQPTVIPHDRHVSTILEPGRHRELIGPPRYDERVDARSEG